jgi:hypothetical protein
VAEVDDITQADEGPEPEVGAVSGDDAAVEPDLSSVEPDTDSPSDTVEAGPDEPLSSPAALAERPVPESPDAALVEGVSGGLTWVPFAAYLGLWMVLVGLTAYFLYGASAEQPARWMPAYVPLLWSGVSLTALGPVLSLVVWMVARTRRPKTARRGLFASSMTRGAVIAFFGTIVWLGTLYALDILAIGGTF